MCNVTTVPFPFHIVLDMPLYRLHINKSRENCVKKYHAQRKNATLFKIIMIRFIEIKKKNKKRRLNHD
jgi:hypothetical protein